MRLVSDILGYAFMAYACWHAASGGWNGTALFVAFGAGVCVGMDVSLAIRRATQGSR